MTDRIASVVWLSIVPLAILTGIGGMYWLASGGALQAVLLTVVSTISAVAAYTARARRLIGTTSKSGIGHIEWWRVVRTLSVILFALIFVVSVIVYIQDLDTNPGR